MDIFEWCEKNFIDFQSIKGENFLSSNGKNFLIVEPTEFTDGSKKLFDEDFNLILSERDINFLHSFETDYFLFEFGDVWYYSSTKKEQVELNVFKYFGKVDPLLEVLQFDYPFLGVHTGYELCNGSRLAEDWVKKAQFLNIGTLGICEYNTLAGSLKFQEECSKANIKSIIGETILVQDKEVNQYKLKLFCENEIGWKNLLNINSQINVFNEGYVTEDYVLDHSEGLFCVICCDVKISNDFADKMVKAFGNKLFYQIDPVEYSSEEKDRIHIETMSDYLSKWSYSIKPILIGDAYYLDKEDFEIKSLLNKVGKIGFQFQSNDQYFKTRTEIVSQLQSLDSQSEKSFSLFEVSVKSLNVLSQACNFKIDTDNFHLPKYVLSDQEKLEFETNDDLFWALITDGFQRKIEGKVEDEDIYWDRISTEAKVIQQGGIVDYFLILADIINWCRKNDILVGVGRGSSAGSLIAYCLNIVELDPIKYDLLFERFLNEARINAGEMVDIDSDFESSRRDDVKRYMESRYGIDYVASIGTYGNFKNKGIIKDFGRETGLDFSETNFVTSLMSKDSEDGDLIDLFKNSNSEPKLKSFIVKNPDLINKINLVIWQPKTRSIHASATLIVPFEDDNGNKKNIYDWLPVRKIDGVLISEWEGKQVENAGFLKEDILATLQLEKFRMILDLIELNHGKKIDWTQDIDVEETEIYTTLWHTGYTEDVFQFTTDNLKSYCKFLKPDRFEELIAANALARPGAMMSNAHIDYAKIKRGEKVPEYDFFLDDITEKTFGLYIYQEQIMAAFKKVTNSSLEEADMFRKIITKLKSGVQNDENFNKYKNLFIDSYLKAGSTLDNANYVWDKLVAFSKYGFNRSHAACYAYEAYVCNWFKFHYPLEFWVTSLTYSKDEDIEKKILEIQKTGSIQLLPPNINVSDKKYTYDLKNNIIYWSLNSVSHAGEKKVDAIIEERNKNGVFLSLSEFIVRMVGKRIDKRVVTHFILCGCFDECEKITNVTQRFDLLKMYLGDDVNEEEFCHANIIKEHFWLMKQKELCGIGHIRFDNVFTSFIAKQKLKTKTQYMSFDEISSGDTVGTFCFTAGVISEIIEFSTKNGRAGKVSINENGKILQITMWNDSWEAYSAEVKSSKGKILLVSGKITEFRNTKSIQINDRSFVEFI